MKIILAKDLRFSQPPTIFTSSSSLRKNIIMKHQFTSQLNGVAHGHRIRESKKGIQVSWKEAMQVAVNIENIVDLLNRGEVHFAYTNNEGQVREARGTRNAAILETLGVKPLTVIDRAAVTVIYWDFDAINKKTGLPGDFRSFVPARMIKA